MSVPTNKKQKTPAVTPRQTIQGHTNSVRGVVHLPGGRRIMTCSFDGSLRLWDLKSGAQVGEDWRDEEDEEAKLSSMALSPNGRTIVSGSGDRRVKLWDVETGKLIAKWIGHTERVSSVCWSADDKQVLSGSFDGTARVWDVETGKTILIIETGHEDVWTVIYSPDHTQIGTGGHNQSAVKIWNAETGKLLATLKHDMTISLAWMSDGKKLISSSSSDLIRIYDTTAWEQIAILEGHTDLVTAITLSQNDRLLSVHPSSMKMK